MKAWHFLAEDCRLRYDDRQLVEPGSVIELPRGRDLVLCEWGLHASKRPIDALKYAPGSVLCRVELSGGVVHDTDKSVGHRREVLWMADITWELHELACWCAEAALRAANVTDERSWNAIRVKRAWMDGEASDADLSAAANAAMNAAWSAAMNATWNAAWNAAGSAAWSAAGSAQNQQLLAVINGLEWDDD